MFPVEEDDPFAFRHVTAEFTNIAARVDGVHDRSWALVFALEFEDDGQIRCLWCGQIVVCFLHAESVTPSIRLEVFDLTVMVPLEIIGTAPTDRGSVEHLKTECSAIRSFIRVYDVFPKGFEDARVVEKGFKCQPLRKVTGAPNGTSSKTRFLEAFACLLAHNDFEPLIPVFDYKDHVVLLPVASGSGACTLGASPARCRSSCRHYATLLGTMQYCAVSVATVAGMVKWRNGTATDIWKNAAT